MTPSDLEELVLALMSDGYETAWRRRRAAERFRTALIGRSWRLGGDLRGVGGEGAYPVDGDSLDPLRVVGDLPLQE